MGVDLYKWFTNRLKKKFLLWLKREVHKEQGDFFFVFAHFVVLHPKREVYKDKSPQTQKFTNTKLHKHKTSQTQKSTNTPKLHKKPILTL